MKLRNSGKLDAELTANLQAFGKLLNGGKVSSELLDLILDNLSRLEARDVGRTTPNSSRLTRPCSGSSSGSPTVEIVSPRPSHKELLAKYPKLAWLFLFHHDGYIRENALSAIHSPPQSPFMLAAIALRLNDWVDEVRSESLRCFSRIAPHLPASLVEAVSHYFLDRWRYWGRWDASMVLAIDQLLERPDIVTAIVRRFQTALVGPLATMLSYALRHPTYDSSLVLLATTAKVPSVRATAIQTIVQGYAKWPTGFVQQWVDKRYGFKRRVVTYDRRTLSVSVPVNEVIALGLQSRSVMVRRVSAQGLIEHGKNFPELEKTIAQLMRDNDASIRERGLFLNKHQKERSDGE